MPRLGTQWLSRTGSVPPPVSLVHLQMIQGVVTKRFASLVDMTGAKGSTEDIDRQALTRSLAAYAILSETGADDAVCAGAVTDGFDDNGMDAIYYDEATARLYVVQAKWLSKEGSTIEVGDFDKFLDGVNDLFHLEFTKCNTKVQGKAAQVQAAMRDSNTRIVLVVAYPSTADISPHVRTRLDKFLAAQNDVSEVVEFKLYNQGVLYQSVSIQTDGKPVNLHVKLLNANKIGDPYQAFYGQIQCADLVDWWKQYRGKLFSSNIRKFLGPSEVNSDIKRSVVDGPHTFWYLNNGVTALCTKISKKPIGGPTPEVMELDCENLTIVNGAQTVGSLVEASHLAPQKIQNARVSLRLISLQDCPPGFGELVTVATNNQNKIEPRDFASLDAQQARLHRELATFDYHYRYKRDSEVKPTFKGCDFEDAAVALACAASLDLAVAAKSNVSSLWADTKRPPYTVIFDDKTAPHSVMRCVEVLREVEKRIDIMSRGKKERDKLALIHGNRFILAEVFNRLSASKFQKPDFDFEAELLTVPMRVTEIGEALIALLTTEFAAIYPMSLFKNAKRCQELRSKLPGAKPTLEVIAAIPDQKTLF